MLGEIKFKDYEKTLGLSKEIFLSLYGKPQSSREIAEMYNKVGEINTILIKYEERYKLHNDS